MNRIKLFEAFVASLNEQTETGGIKFSWLPNDSEVSNPINKTIKTPETIKEALDIIKSQGLEEMGVFIGSEKNIGGFTVIFLPDPITKEQHSFLAQVFNYPNYTPISDKLTKETLSNFKTMSLLKEYSPNIFDQIAENFTNKEKAEIRARLGDLGLED